MICPNWILGMLISLNGRMRRREDLVGISLNGRMRRREDLVGPLQLPT